MASKANAPVARFRIGYVDAAVWKNDSGFYSVTINRSYKDDDGNWQNTDSFGHGDLANASLVLQRAERFIAEQ